MSRKRKAPVRKVYPDPKFHSEIVSKFINSIMYDGKRSTAEKILYDALDKIKSKNISVINVAANRNLLLIQGLIALCPLLGLLGTVTGMIEVFDIMAITGTGNARAMASGIARATLPTMTGLFISIVGLFLLTAIKSTIDKATLDIKYGIEQI